MKKSILFLLSIMICFLTMNIVSAKVTATSPELAHAIRLYKTKNYTQSYLELNNIVQKDPANTLAYYYLAMTCSQMGNRQEAIENYSKVITLSPNGRVGLYAQKGKRCLETPDKCSEQIETYEDDLDRFIKRNYGNGFSDEVMRMHETQRIENLKREINRKPDVEPQKFKEYKDFSASAPTNDEIVAALRVLQRAGLGYNNDFSMLGNDYNNEYGIMNMLMGNKYGNTELSPQLIQAMLNSQLTSSF